MILFSTSFFSSPIILIYSLPLGYLHTSTLSPKEEKTGPSNYRPIAITSPISKTMETIIIKQLLAFLEASSRLSNHPYGFRQARSTGDLLVYAVHTWSSALESSDESRLISLGISKAFDYIWHQSLLAKLPMFGLHPNLITWIASFLSGRSIAIRIDGFLSRPLSINSGVPQGSVISPVLFIVFINYPLSSISSSIFSFADDTYCKVIFFNPIHNTLPSLIFHHTLTPQPHFSPMTKQT